MPVAVIVGVGPSAGLGATLCRHAAQAGLHVFAGGRTSTQLEQTKREIEAAGGNCTPVVTDVTAEE
ncbi:MAG: SDR family NAD(P)-dependent oxidoreductase, partial [bacterium]